MPEEEQDGQLHRVCRGRPVVIRLGYPDPQAYQLRPRALFYHHQHRHIQRLLGNTDHERRRIQVEKDYFSRVWDVHNGECLRTVILSNSPPLTQGKFTKTSDIGLFSSLNSRITLFNIKSGKTIREYKGHENNDYIVEFGFTQTLGGDLDGFITGSENGMVHRYKWKNETPIDSLKIDSEGSTADLILTAPGFFVASGRTWSSVHKILY